MTNSARRRSNNYARLIASMIDTDLSQATLAFDHAAARDYAREFGFAAHILHEANFAYLAELLNRRMFKRFPGKTRAFNPYADTFRPEYREPIHDPGRPRREYPAADRAPRDFAEAGQW